MNKQLGQSMVEYVVILGALSAALLAPGLGSIGTSPTDQNSVLKAISDKHRGHGYTISLSEPPETDELLVLADYYDRLGKYPELSAQLRSGGTKLGAFSSHLTQLGSAINQLKAGDITFPPNLPSTPPLPSFP